MNHHLGAALVFARAGGLGEAGVEVGPRRRGDQAEGVRAASAASCDGQKPGKAGMFLVVAPDRGPVGLEMEPAVGLREAVEEMGVLEGLGAVEALTRARPPPAGGWPEAAKVASISSQAVISKPGCSAPSRLARPEITSWLERQSGKGSITALTACRKVWPLAV